jgi:hypothetical protein
MSRVPNLKRSSGLGVTSAITEKSEQLKNELEAVSYLIYDVTLTGTHSQK